MQQTINLTFPKSWSELTDKQLLFVFTLLADGYPATDIKVKCLLKWTGTKVIGCIEGKKRREYIKGYDEGYEDGYEDSKEEDGRSSDWDDYE